ncbi:MAG: signal peptidase I [Acidimicrobiia bacterium]|nr:signal peptidase I [Acidimicrobiia bacterium]
MDVSEQARVLRRRWVLIAAVVVVGLIALSVFGRGPKPAWRATTALVFTESGSPPRDAFIQDLTSAAALARTPIVTSRVAARLNATNDPEDLARLITARANPDANTVELTTTSAYLAPGKAGLLVNAFAVELAGALQDQQAALAKQASDAAAADQQASAAQLKDVEAKLAASAKAPIDQQEALRAQRDAIIRHLQDTIVNNLAVPRQQALTHVGGATATKIEQNGLAPTTRPGWMLAAFVLAIIGCAVALVVERVQGRLYGRNAVERAFGLPVLAEVPAVGDAGVVAATAPLSAAADAFRDLRTSLARLGRPPIRHGSGRGTQLEMTAAMVTSAGPHEGKTTAAVNLAAAVAETGKSVLVIDCNMRQPDAHRQLGAAPGPGLSDVLLGTATLDQVAVPTAVPGVRLVGGGHPTDNPAALLARQHDFVALARMLADFVVLDAPPLSVHDASELVWMVDAVVVSCRDGRTTVKAALHAQELLGLLGSPPGGVVLFTEGGEGEGAEVGQVPLAVPPADRDATPPAPPPPPPPPTLSARIGPPPPPPAPPSPPEPVGTGGSIAYAPSGSVGVLARPAPPAARPPTGTDADTVDWATRAEPQHAGADSDAIRRQLALPARRVAGWAGTAALMIVLWFIIRAFLFQSFYIPSPSMAPALVPGDRVLVSKLSYRLHDIHRGDIVVFKRPPHLEAGPEVKDLVKRVIGLPGDTVEARDGEVIVNGTALTEPYVPKGAVTTSVAPTHIPAHHYWVMGDNRSVSEDSRYFGPISQSLVVGRVFLQIWPFSHIGLI